MAFFEDFRTRQLLVPLTSLWPMRAFLAMVDMKCRMMSGTGSSRFMSGKLSWGLGNWSPVKQCGDSLR